MKPSQLKFSGLSREDAFRAVCVLRSSGLGEYDIAAITGLSVEMIQQILAGSFDEVVPWTLRHARQ